MSEGRVPEITSNTGPGRLASLPSTEGGLGRNLVRELLSRKCKKRGRERTTVAEKNVSDYKMLPFLVRE